MKLEDTFERLARPSEAAPCAWVLVDLVLFHGAAVKRANQAGLIVFTPSL